MNKKIKLMQLCIAALGLWIGQTNGMYNQQPPLFPANPYGQPQPGGYGMNPTVNTPGQSTGLKTFGGIRKLNISAVTQPTTPIEQLVNPVTLRTIDNNLDTLWDAFQQHNDALIPKKFDDLRKNTLQSNNNDLMNAYNDIITATENGEFYQSAPFLSTAINKMKIAIASLLDLWPLDLRSKVAEIPLTLITPEEPSLYYSTRYALRAPFTGAWDWTKGTARSGLALGKGAWSGIKGGMHSAKEWFSPSAATKLEVQNELNKINLNYGYDAIEKKLDAGQQLTQAEQKIFDTYSPQVYMLRKRIEGWTPTLVKAGVLGATAGAAYLKYKSTK